MNLFAGRPVRSRWSDAIGGRGKPLRVVGTQRSTCPSRRGAGLVTPRISACNCFAEWQQSIRLVDMNSAGSRSPAGFLTRATPALFALKRRPISAAKDFSA